MSINLPQGATSPQSTVTLSSPVAFPFTKLLWMKVEGTNGTGFNVARFFGVYNSLASEYCRIGVYNDGSSSAGPRGDINDDINPQAKTNAININNALEGIWRPVALSVDASDFTIYTVDGNGVLVSSTGAHGRNLSDIVDITLFPDSWANGQAWIALPQVLPSKITEEQFYEYATTLNIAGTSPLFKPDTTTDWGAGSLSDLSGNGNSVTPATPWTHSTDEPTALVLLGVSGVSGNVVPGQTATISATGDIGATPGTVELRNADGTFSVEQNIETWSQGDGVSTGTIDITGVLGGLNYDIDHELVVTTSAGAVIAYGPVALNPPSGNAAVDVVDPVTDDTSIFYQVQSGTPATGNQIEHDDAANTTVNPDGTASQIEARAFQARVWDHADNTWGSWQTVTVQAAAEAPAGILTIGTITKDHESATIPYTYDSTDATGFEYSTDGGTTWTTVSSPISLTGLTELTQYTGQVRPFNDAGPGTAVSYTFTTDELLQAPLGTPLIGTPSIASTSWSVPYTYSGDDATGFQHRINGGNWVDSTSPITMQGATPETNYLVEVRAYNDIGNGGISQITITTEADTVDPQPDETLIERVYTIEAYNDRMPTVQRFSMYQGDRVRLKVSHNFDLAGKQLLFRIAPKKDRPARFTLTSENDQFIITSVMSETMDVANKVWQIILRDNQDRVVVGEGSCDIRHRIKE